MTPEQLARVAIDALLIQAGWAVQDANAANIHAARGVALREFPLKPGHGFADYLPCIQGCWHMTRASTCPRIDDLDVL